MTKNLNDKELVEIATKYSKSLLLPTVKSDKQFVLCPIGLPASGKTTVVKPLAELLSLVRVSNDEIRHLLKEEGYNWDRASEVGVYVIKAFLSQGYSVAIDSDCADTEKAGKLVNYAKEHDIKTVWIHINPPKQFVIEKIKSFSYPHWLWESAAAGIKNYEDRETLHAGLNHKYAYVFDTSKSDIDRQIDDAIERIKSVVY